MTKVKAALKVYSNSNRTMKYVRKFEENAEKRGHQSLNTDAKKFASVKHLSYVYLTQFAKTRMGKC